MSTETFGRSLDEGLIWSLRPRRLPDSYWRHVGMGVLIYPNVALNPAAAQIWTMCDGTRTLGEMQLELTGSTAEITPSLTLDLLYTVYLLADCGALTFVRTEEALP